MPKELVLGSRKDDLRIPYGRIYIDLTVNIGSKAHYFFMHVLCMLVEYKHEEIVFL